MSEFKIISNPAFDNTSSNAMELYGDSSLQFVYYGIDADNMMGFTPEDEEVIMILYVLSGNVSISTPEGKIEVKENMSVVFDNIEHTYILTANEFSKVLVFTNTAKVQKVNETNDFRKMIEDIEQKDIYTTGHSHRVRMYSCAIALALDSAYDIIPLATAAGLHDVGKINVPKEILQKPDKLTTEEYMLIKQHPLDTYELLKNSFHEDIVNIATLHHERLDGSGYPYGLGAADIPLEVRILAIADAFDAMTSHRNYQQDKTYLDAVLTLEGLPKQYDQKITAVLKKLVEDGSLFHLHENHNKKRVSCNEQIDF